MSWDCSSWPSTDLPDDANQKAIFHKNNPFRDYPKSPLQLPASRPPQRGVSRSSLNAGRGAVDAAASGAQTSSQGGLLRGFVSEGTARGRPMLKRFAPDFGGSVPSPSRPLALGVPRTAKSCGSGTRCWCHVRGGCAGPTGPAPSVNPRITVAKGIRTPGRARSTP